MLARINSGNYRGVVTLQSRKLAGNKAFLAFCTESRILRQQGFRRNSKALFSCLKMISFSAILDNAVSIRLESADTWPVAGEWFSPVWPGFSLAVV